MSRLRSELDAANAAYSQLHYDGDLASELLPRPAAPRWWLLPLATAALAAAVAIALRHPTPPTATVPQPSIAMTITSPSTTHPARSPLFAVADIDYEVYVHDARANVRDTMRVLTGSVDRALAAPVVTDSVRKVDEVTDDLKQIANTTWTQIRSAPRPPC